MKTVRPFVLVLFSLMAATAHAQLVPQILHYQGRVAVSGTNFTGNGLFKFALVNGAGSVSHWSNDGTSAGGSEPTASVSLPTTNGLYAVLLGDTTIAGMTLAVPLTVFTNTDVRLRVWFSNGSGFQRLTPDQRIAAVGYALVAATVQNGAITTEKLANGAVDATKLANNAVTAAKIEDGAVTSSKIAFNTVVSSNLADSIALGATNVNGQLDVYRTAAGTPGISLVGNGSRISTYGSDGLEQIRLWGESWGEILLYDSTTNNRLAVMLSANNTSGGLLRLYQADGQNGAQLRGDVSGSGRLDLYNTNGAARASLIGQGASGGGQLQLNNPTGANVLELLSYSYGGQLTLRDELGVNAAVLASSSSGGGFQNLYNADGGITLNLDGDSGGGGYISIRNTNASSRLVLDGQGSSGGGQATLYAADGSTTVQIYGDSGAGAGLLQVNNNVSSTRTTIKGEGISGGGEIDLADANGTSTLELYGAEDSGTGSAIYMRDASGNLRVELDGDYLNGGAILLYGTNGSANIILDSESSGEGRITCDVLQINGGSDLSEKFNIKSVHQAPQPGMIVCIDPENPGQLVTSSTAYDRTVAGIISGAGGVKPGMLMGQQGTLADGKHPVALTGRVYCYVDADQGAIKPGDMITTSATPGHGMKVRDHSQAHGAVIGKAMSSLEKGRGLVLVLVSLQ
jgi:hypothetical protein